jgi:hypothetical protein
MDATQFRQASHAVWEAMAPGWDTRHAYFEERARPVAAHMLERLEPAPGETILELAAGTGVVGFAAAQLVEPGGTVIVSDFSLAMVEAASRHAADLGSRTSNAAFSTPSGSTSRTTPSTECSAAGATCSCPTRKPPSPRHAVFSARAVDSRARSSARPT